MMECIWEKSQSCVGTRQTTADVYGKLARLLQQHWHKVTVIQLHASSRSDFKIIGLIETHELWE
jgi:hypothetical protein